MKSHFDFNIESYDDTINFLFNKMYYIDSSDKEEDEYYFFNNVVFDETLNKNFDNKKEASGESKKPCQHSWKKYVGFTEVYYYCEYCDEKSNHDFDSSRKWYIK